MNISVAFPMAKTASCAASCTSGSSLTSCRSLARGRRSVDELSSASDAAAALVEVDAAAAEEVLGVEVTMSPLGPTMMSPCAVETKQELVEFILYW